jgi:phage terminase small subunit
MTKRKPVQLTGKQQAFVDAYFALRFNGTEAARQAGYAGDDNTLAATASRMLRNNKIRSAIDKRFKQTKMGPDEVLGRLSYIATGSMEDFVDPDSCTLDLKKAQKAKALGLIKKLKIKTIINSKDDTEIEEIEFELHDPMRAMEMLGKHWRVFERAGEVDWRKEVEAAGLDPDKFTSELAAQFAEHMKQSAKVEEE